LLKVDEFIKSSATPPLDGTTPLKRSVVEFITFEQTADGGRMSLSVTGKNGPLIVARLSEDVQAYLSSLMAPIATGEKMTQSDYLALVTSVYGSPVAKEIAASHITLSIAPPGKVAKVEGGEQKAHAAVFTISVLHLLVLDTPISCSLSWKN
jgi:hypothetical protein